MLCLLCLCRLAQCFAKQYIFGELLAPLVRNNLWSHLSSSFPKTTGTASTLRLPACQETLQNFCLSPLFLCLWTNVSPHWSCVPFCKLRGLDQVADTATLLIPSYVPQALFRNGLLFSLPQPEPLCLKVLVGSPQPGEDFSACSTKQTRSSRE